MCSFQTPGSEKPRWLSIRRRRSCPEPSLDRTRFSHTVRQARRIGIPGTCYGDPLWKHAFALSPSLSLSQPSVSTRLAPVLGGRVGSNSLGVF